ncbi:NAD(P)H:quinone oxidoreductase [Ktedonosporobacter rubrisoli]|uniref:NAD(P)H:quinone oxidoreductase n=1 Tax=Ktedonosporobacter rubrisoli TaxID=2509675 RepID=A0A4P6JWD1_KTERU|nr:NAD(P)H:quinone oxidoreductase [Ktedonosporobacter rubrisoli]QBD79680.1 NAD(P)H:quinone oxidoreductase [Ktedonosporobacter rubrisoli]
MSLRIAVIYYSATGNVYQLARAVAEGAEELDAEVRLRRVAELASEEARAKNPAWKAHYEETCQTVSEAQLDDLEWADAYAFGTPTRFGTPAAQLKEFLDQAGGLWAKGVLANKAVTTFTSAITLHGGQEATLLSLNNVFYHWGCLLVPPGYTDQAVYDAGGNPYGTSLSTPNGKAENLEAVLQAARYQGKRLAKVAASLHRQNIR